MSWLDGTDDVSRGREDNHKHATGHSSMLKSPISTTADEIRGAAPPSTGKVMNAHTPGSLSSMGGLGAVGDKAKEWTKIEITVDSGACETVMPMGVCHSISVLASRQYIER